MSSSPYQPTYLSLAQVSLLAGRPCGTRMAPPGRARSRRDVVTLPSPMAVVSPPGRPASVRISPGFGSTYTCVTQVPRPCVYRDTDPLSRRRRRPAIAPSSLASGGGDRSSRGSIGAQVCMCVCVCARALCGDRAAGPVVGAAVPVWRTAAGRPDPDARAPRHRLPRSQSLQVAAGKCLLASRSRPRLGLEPPACSGDPVCES